MPGTEELMARLQQLENGYYGDKEAARQKQFFDTYGARFSNNRGLGLAILNELDARGIDTSAADEAVQEILDTLRTECNEIIESIKDVQQQAIENAQKVETISNVVSEAVAANPDASAAVDTTAADQGMTEGVVPPDPAMTAMDPNGEFNPDEVPPEETPTDDSGMVTSDVRMKRIQRMRDSWGKTRAQKKAAEPKKDEYKPSAGILAAAQGGR